MSFFGEYSRFKDEIDLALIQNGCVEIEPYSIIASLIRESKNGCCLSVRDVSNRRKSDISKRFYGNAGFPDFVILNREKDQNNITVYGCIEVKMPTIELNKEDEQIRGHKQSFDIVLYTNGIRWILFDNGKTLFDITLGEIIKDNKRYRIKWYGQEKWEALLERIDNIEWFK